MSDQLSEKDINVLLTALSENDDLNDKDYTVLNGMIKNMESCFRTAYDKGFSAGQKSTEKVETEKSDSAYEKGLNEAWAVADKILDLTSDFHKRKAILGNEAPKDYIKNHSAKDAILLFKNYETNQNCQGCKYNGEIPDPVMCLDCTNNSLYVPDWEKIVIDDLDEKQLCFVLKSIKAYLENKTGAN